MLLALDKTVFSFVSKVARLWERKRFLNIKVTVVFIIYAEANRLFSSLESSLAANNSISSIQKLITSADSNPSYCIIMFNVTIPPVFTE